jgi:hypothetical protein
MSDLRDLLRAAADPPAPEELDHTDLRRRARRIRRLRQAWTAAAVLLVAAVGAWASMRPITPDARVEFVDTPPDADGRAHTEPVWSPLPEAPLRMRWGSFAAWTGEEFVVWGGYAGVGTPDEYTAADGAAYDPATRRWRPIAAAPLEGMHSGASVWTGDELLMLGGFGDPNGRAGATAAAAYAPRTDMWRVLPGLPAPFGAAVWSGETSEVVVVGAGGDGTGPRSAWALDGNDRGWRQLPRTPELPNRYDDLAFSLVTGHGGVYLVASDAAWRLDLRDPTRWVRLPDPPLGPGRGGAPLVAWTDAGLLTANGDGAALYDGGSWRSVPAPPVDVDAEASAVVGDDGMVVAVDPRSGAAAAFDATREWWAALPDVPLRSRFNAAVAGGTHGSHTVVFVWAGSNEANLPFVDGAVLRTPTGFAP